MTDDWDSFADDAERRVSRPCAVARMLAEHIPPEHRPAVQTIIENSGLPASTVHRALVQRLGDRAPSPWVIRVHRRAECPCRKKTDR